MYILLTMPNDDSNAPDNQVLGQPTSPLSKDSDNFNRELDSLPTARQNIEIRRLYSWLAFLTSLFIILVGLSAGFAFWLKLQRDQIQKQLSDINAERKIEIERVDNLEIRINSLNTQLNSLSQSLGVLNKKVSQGLPNQIKGVQKDLSSVKASVKKVTANTVTRDQMKKIQQAMQAQKKSKR